MLGKELISTTQAAERLGLSRQRVLQIIDLKWLPAQKVGRNYVIDAADLRFVTYRPSSGWTKGKKRPKI